MADRDEMVVAAQPDSWRATLLAHRPVVDVRRVEQLGSVEDLVFDPLARQLVGLLLRRGRAESKVTEMAWRAFGGSLGLTYIPMDQVIALNGDVVTVDPMHNTPHAQLAEHLPRLSKALGFAVVTIQGKRLGRLVDLVLDREGRSVLCYVVEPGGQGIAPHRAADTWTRTAGPALVAPDGTPNPAASGDSAEVAPAAGAPRPADVIVVPATLDVRVGRDLVVVAQPAGSSPTPGSDGKDMWTATPDEPSHENSPPTPTWQEWEADAPTEQMRH